MSKITAFLDAHPAFRSAVRVAGYTFVGVFLPALMGWLSDVNDWVNSDGAAFPSVSTLTKAAVSAFSAVLSGALAYVYNRVPLGASSSYGGTPPPEVPPEFP